MCLLEKENAVFNRIIEALLNKQYMIPYLQLVHKKMEEINNNNNNTIDIRNDESTAEIPFLAVDSPYFVKRPKLLKRKNLKLYGMLEHRFVG